MTPSVSSVSRTFADGREEPWSYRVADGWRAYVLDMLGHGHSGTERPVSVRVRLLNGQLVTYRRRRVA